MWIDFHVHGKLTKKSDFEREYFQNITDYAQEVGLDGFVLSEHFNTKDFYRMFNDLGDQLTYDGEAYLANNGIRIFMGMEIDVAHGGHVIVAARREDILQIRRRLDRHEQPGEFIAFETLLDLAEGYGCLIIGAHPFRGEHPLALKQPLSLLERLDALDLNANDIYNKGLPQTQMKLATLSEQLAVPIVTGSDAHYPVQLGSVRTQLEGTSRTIAEVKQCIAAGKFTRAISPTLDIRVFAAKVTKARLKANDGASYRSESL